MNSIKSKQVVLILFLFVVLVGLVIFKSYFRAKNVSMSSSASSSTGIIRDHNLGCDQLPKNEEVLAILDANREIVRSLRNENMLVSPNTFTAESSFNEKKLNCPEKGDIVIVVNPGTNKLEVEDKIGETFKGIPYRVYSM